MPDIQLLDNPMWSALTTAHSHLALGNQLARAYPPEIGPLGGLTEQSPAAYEDLRAIAEPDSIRVLFLKEPPRPRPGWTFVRGGLVDQMLHTGSRIDDLPQPIGMRRLTKSDVPAMVELAKLTEPGPFRNRTHELGAFFGIFEGDRLLAMAGERMRVPGFVEVSAVCTHPDARGRGYARTLMSTVMKLIRHEGDMPFLHTFADNLPAIRIYESLGFAKRCTFHLAVLKNES
jgi:GNAT superfamily N-acetyltransferase